MQTPKNPHAVALGAITSPAKAAAARRNCLKSRGNPMLRHGPALIAEAHRHARTCPGDCAALVIAADLATPRLSGQRITSAPAPDGLPRLTSMMLPRRTTCPAPTAEPADAATPKGRR